MWCYLGGYAFSQEEQGVVDQVSCVIMAVWFTVTVRVISEVKSK